MDVSFDVESLFTIIPVKEKIEYVLHKIYVNKSIKPFCKKSIFKKNISEFDNSSLIKQIDGYPMGGPVSVVFSDIFTCKMEDDVVVPAKPIFYKNVNDELFRYLNSYQTNIKLTLEENPKYQDYKKE